MKFKKNIAIILAIILCTSCFGGIVTIYAESNDNTNNIANAFPTPQMVKLEPDLNKEQLPIAENRDGDKITFYDGPKSEMDIYNIDKEELRKLRDKGYSIQEIVEADAIGNLIFVKPSKLLESKGKTGKSLKELKNDILKERKGKDKKITSNTKKKYGLTNASSEGISDEFMSEIETISKETKKPVKELLQVYRNNLKKFTED